MPCMRGGEKMTRTEQFIKRAREIDGKAWDSQRNMANFEDFCRSNLPRLLDALERQEEALEFYRMGNGMEAIECQRDVEKLLGGGE